MNQGLFFMQKIMARPERNNVDYFPFLCEDGKKMFYLEEQYGNDGFATFVKILRELAKTDFHYLDLSKNITLMFLSAKCKVSKDVLECIINDLVDLEKFDSILWKENKIIWCQDFIDSIQDAYKKRNNECITYKGLLVLLISLGVRKPLKSKTKAPLKPQSIVDYNKLKDSDENPITKFTSWFSLRRTEYLEIESNFKRLSYQDKKNLEELKNLYEKKDFEKVMVNICNDKYCNESNRIIPSHFLQYFDNYISKEQKTLLTKKQKINRGWAV